MSEIRHGFTLADLDGIARAACASDRSLSSDMSTRYDIAWSAVAEHLWLSDEPPARADLVSVGLGAIYREVQEMKHTYGIVRNGRTLMPTAVKYGYIHGIDHAEDRVERWAVPQILSDMRAVDREMLTAPAVHEDYDLAAAALGLKYDTFAARVRKAREEFRTRWYSPETAPPRPRVGLRGRERAPQCGRGHTLDPDSKFRHCRVCARERAAAQRAALDLQATCVTCGCPLTRTQRQRCAGYCPDHYGDRPKPSFVPPGPARAHIAALRDAGMVLREMSALCGVSVRVLSHISTRASRVSVEMSDRICAVPVPEIADAVGLGKTSNTCLIEGIT